MGRYFFKTTSGDFLPLSGGTVTGDTFIQSSLSATTFFSGSTKLEDIFLTSGDLSGTTSVSEGSNINVNNVGIDYKVSVNDSPSFNNLKISGNTSASTVYVENNIEPQTDNSSDLGTSFKRFRDLNTVNGVAVNFTASTKMYTETLRLGQTDVTENNIVLSGQTIDGGGW